jgi:hypothetical protein
MSTAFDLRTYGTFSHMSDEDALDDTFDQAVTRPGEEVTFEAWAEWFGVNVVKVHLEADICLGLLALSPCFKAKEYRDDALYEVGCILHGSEEAYLEFLALER